MERLRARLLGREVENPVIKLLLVAVVIFVVLPIGGLLFLAGLVLFLVVVAFVVLLSPIWLLVHSILRANGRRGFIVTDGRRIVLSFTREAFRKVRYA